MTDEPDDVDVWPPDADWVDWVDDPDDPPLVCGVESPDMCESCM